MIDVNSLMLFFQSWSEISNARTSKKTLNLGQFWLFQGLIPIRIISKINNPNTLFSVSNFYFLFAYRQKALYSSERRKDLILWYPKPGFESELKWYGI